MQNSGMDYTELIALAIVGIALFVYLRSFLKKRKDTCCSKSCELKSKTLRKGK